MFFFLLLVKNSFFYVWQTLKLFAILLVNNCFPLIWQTWTFFALRDLDNLVTDLNCSRYQIETFFYICCFILFCWREMLTNVSSFEPKITRQCNGCGSVGRAVASDPRGLQFESSQWQTFCYQYTVNCIEKTKIKQKRPWKLPGRGCGTVGRVVDLRFESSHQRFLLT